VCGVWKEASMNRAERRAVAKKVVTRNGTSGQSTKRVRKQLADSIREKTESEKIVDVKPRVRDIGDGVGMTEAGLIVPAEAEHGLVVPDGG
jgi:hypothetical protein